MATIKLNVNRQQLSVDVDPSTPLLWVLRDHLNLTGTKYGCGIAQCGACTVHVNGSASRSCVLPVERVSDAEIVTIEGLANNHDHVLQRLWVEMNVPQCGYCQSGILMAAAAMLEQVEKPTDSNIDSHISNICRCGTYPRVRAAIHKATRSGEA